MPPDVFRAILVHEFAHACLASQFQGARPNQVVEEGFAEALAYDYLNRDFGTTSAKATAAAMMSSTDPVYGVGLRLVFPVLRQRGAKDLARILATGQGASVGLSG
jgi:hypothetical protein